MRLLVLTQAVGADAPPDEADVLAQAALVSAAARRLGHTVSVGEVTLDLGPLRELLAREPPDLVMNLVESLAGEDELAPLVPALLEAVGIPFTGSPAAALALSNDKPRAKARLAAQGLPTAPWRVRGAPAADGETGRYIVKPARRHASQGIDDDAVVDVAAEGELDARIEERSRTLGCECFAERYIDGRELSVTLLARGATLEVIGIAELDLSAFPAGKPRIVGYSAKWAAESFEATHTPRRFWSPAAEPTLHAEVARLAHAAALALGVTGYARVDLRVDGAGRPWILEVNANPCLAPDAGFLAATSHAGLADEGVLAAIVAAAKPGEAVPRTTPPAGAGGPPTRGVRAGPDPSAVELSDTLSPDQAASLRRLVERTGFFTAAEVDVAAELLDEFWAKGAAASGYRFVAAVAQGRLLGYACFGPVPCSDTSFDLYWIAVDPDSQGLGIGRRLVERVAARARAEGGRQLHLDTSSRPIYAPTRAFYLRTGFRIAATLPDFYREGDGKVMFVRDL